MYFISKQLLNSLLLIYLFLIHCMTVYKHMWHLAQNSYQVVLTPAISGGWDCSTIAVWFHVDFLLAAHCFVDKTRSISIIGVWLCSSTHQPITTHTHTIFTAITSKVCPSNLSSGFWLEFISKSLDTKLKVSICSGYDLCPPGYIQTHRHTNSILISLYK